MRRIRCRSWAWAALALLAACGDDARPTPAVTRLQVDAEADPTGFFMLLQWAATGDPDGIVVDAAVEDGPFEELGRLPGGRRSVYVGAGDAVPDATVFRFRVRPLRGSRIVGDGAEDDVQHPVRAATWVGAYVAEEGGLRITWRPAALVADAVRLDRTLLPGAGGERALSPVEVGPDTTTYLDPGEDWVDGASLRYTVTYLRRGLVSPGTTGTSPVAPLLRPRDLQMRAEGLAVTLSWTHPSAAARAMILGRQSPLPYEPSSVRSLPVGTVSYVDTLPRHGVYTYSVFARGLYQDSSAASVRGAVPPPELAARFDHQILDLPDAHLVAGDPSVGWVLARTDPYRDPGVFLPSGASWTSIPSRHDTPSPVAVAAHGAWAGAAYVSRDAEPQVRLLSFEGGAWTSLEEHVPPGTLSGSTVGFDVRAGEAGLAEWKAGTGGIYRCRSTGWAEELIPDPSPDLASLRIGADGRPMLASASPPVLLRGGPAGWTAEPVGGLGSGDAILGLAPTPDGGALVLAEHYEGSELQLVTVVRSDAGWSPPSVIGPYSPNTTEYGLEAGPDGREAVIEATGDPARTVLHLRGPAEQWTSLPLLNGYGARAGFGADGRLWVLDGPAMGWFSLRPAGMRPYVLLTER